MNPDGTITFTNPHNERDYSFTFTAEELGKFPGYQAYYTKIDKKLETLCKMARHQMSIFERMIGGEDYINKTENFLIYANDAIIINHNGH